MIRPFLCVPAILAILASPTFAQTSPPANNFNFTLSGSASGITRFEATYDGGATWAPTLPPLPSPVGGVYNTDAPASLTVGNTYSIALRACNTAGCGAASSSLGFTFVGFKPTATVNSITPLVR